MLAGAAMSPNNLCAWVIERCWPSWMFSRKNGFTWVGDIMVKSQIIPTELVLWEGEGTLFSRFESLNPHVGKQNINIFWPGYDKPVINVIEYTDALEMQRTASIHFVKAFIHFVKVSQDKSRPKGRKWYWYTSPLKENLRNALCSGWVFIWTYASFKSVITNLSSAQLC